MLQDQSLTLTKYTFELIIITTFLIAAWRLYCRKHHFNNSIYKLFFYSVILTIVSELTFLNNTYFVNFSIATGHIFKLLSFWLILLSTTFETADTTG